MGAINNYSFDDFKNALVRNLGSETNINIEASENMHRLKSIFDIAARSDNGDNQEILETDIKDFKNLVKNTLEALKNGFEKGKNSLKQSEFIAGNSKTKQNGSLTPDRVNEYENGDLVKVTIGFDDDDNGQIEVAKGETLTELNVGNSRTKKN